MLSPLKCLGQPRLRDLRDGLDWSGDGSQQAQSLVMDHLLLESHGFPWLRAPKGEDRSHGFPWSHAFPRSRASCESRAMFSRSRARVANIVRHSIPSFRFIAPAMTEYMVVLGHGGEVDGIC